MAPPWVLLNRVIFFEHDVAASGKASEGGGEPTIGIARRVPSSEDITEANLAYMRDMKLDPHLASPPELSSLRILRPTESIPWLCQDITDGFIASADKNLVALYAGPYRAGTNNLDGGYLIYDGSTNSLSTIPQPPYDYTRDGVGNGAAAVLCLDGAEYVLGELTKVGVSDPPEAVLCTWQSSTAEWVVKNASFPPELSAADHLFEADTCFSFGGSVFCWVDLFKGMVVCDLGSVLLPHGAAQPGLRFVPLPGECPTYDRIERPKLPLKAEEFRSMACVGGSIRFVTMDGYGERSGEEVWLAVWTLSPDLCSWKKGKVYRVRDIWESEAHRSLGLLRTLPSFPVLSRNEEDVVYLILTDLNVAADFRAEYKSQYLIRVDMERNKVEYRPTNTEQIRDQLLVTEFSAYLQSN